MDLLIITSTATLRQDWPNLAPVTTSNMLHHYCAIKYTNLHGGTYSLPHLSITHTFPILFSKLFQKFLGPFSGPWGLLPSIFEFPFFRYVSPYFFPTFDLFSTSFFTVFNLLMIGSHHIQTGVTTYGPSPKHGHHLQHQLNLHRLPFTTKRWSLTSTATPTPMKLKK